MSLSLLETLMGSGTRARIIQWLYVEAKPGETYTESELTRLTGVPAGSIHKALMQLTEGQLIERVNARRGPEYRAPQSDPRLKHLFMLLRQDSEIVKLLQRALKSHKFVDYACVFGSFARGTTHAGSDIDVLILENGEDRLAVMTTLSKVTDKIGREVNPQFYRSEEFQHLLNKGEPIALSIASGARIDLKGAAPWQT